MAEAMTFRILLRMQIKKGMGQEFERVWQEVADLVTADPGNRGQWLSRCAEQEDVYYVISDWVDEERFRQFEHSEEHVQHRKKLGPYRLAGGMDTLEAMHVVAHRPGDVPEVKDQPRSDNGQVRVFVYYATDNPSTIERAYHQVSTKMKGTAGLLSNELLHSVNDPTGFVVASRWSRLDAHRAWEQGPVHHNLTAPLRPFRDSRMDRPFGVYQVKAEY